MEVGVYLRSVVAMVTHSASQVSKYYCNNKCPGWGCHQSKVLLGSEFCVFTCLLSKAPSASSFLSCPSVPLMVVYCYHCYSNLWLAADKLCGPLDLSKYQIQAFSGEDDTVSGTWSAERMALSLREALQMFSRSFNILLIKLPDLLLSLEPHHAWKCLCARWSEW